MPAKFQNDPVKNVGEDRNLRSKNDHIRGIATENHACNRITHER